MFENICVIGFDADDTLWDNEIYFRKSEASFCSLMRDFMNEKECSERLFKTETHNIPLYGYGVKSFILSMLETAISIAGEKMTVSMVEDILAMARRQLLEKPVLLDGVAQSLPAIAAGYKLILATKGDLIDQERKLELSGLKDYFMHVEIMSEKTEKEYLSLLDTLAIEPRDFLMVGNSLKSDILPVLKIGGHAIHIPYHTTWLHETISEEIISERLITVSDIREAAEFLSASVCRRRRLSNPA